MTVNTKIDGLKVNRKESEKIVIDEKGGFPKRYIVVLLCSLATFFQYTLRSNLSVTIVAMVNDTYLSGDDDHVIEEYVNKHSLLGCPLDATQLNKTIHKRLSASNEQNEGYFDWQPSTQGLILGAFYYGYIITQINGGQLAEFFGPKLLIGCAMITSTLLTLITPLAAELDAYAVVAVRVITGLSQGLISPSIYTLYAKWIPANERGTALAVYSVGGYAGTVATMSLSAVLCEHGFAGGWPSVFYVLGIFGCICSVCWFNFVYNSPEENPTITSSELLFLKKHVDTTSKGTKNKAALKVPWLKILTSSQMWLIAIAKFSCGWCLLLFLNKLPSYLETVLHFSIEKNGLINATAYSTIAISLFLFGFLSDFISRKKLLNKNVSRKLFEAITLLGSAICVLMFTYFPCDDDVIVLLIVLCMVFLGAQAAGDAPTVVDVAPDYSGSLYGITHAIGSIPGFLAPIFVGILLDNDPDSVQMWNYVFYTSAAIFAFGCFCFLFVSTEPQPWGLISQSKLNSKNDVKANIEESVENASVY